MTAFLIAAAVLTVALVAWLVRPLLRQGAPTQAPDGDRLNIAIHKDLLANLEADLAQGRISQADFEAARDELQLRLLDETQLDAPATPKPLADGSARRSAWLLGLGTPVVAALLYLQLGAPQAISPPAAVTREQIDGMVEKLAQELKARPDNPQGWAMLARSYKVMGRHTEALSAFEKSTAYLATDADATVDYAELLAQKAGNRFAGKPEELLQQALKINPQHPPALMMLGIADYQQSRFASAAQRWETILGMMDPMSADAQQMRSNINQAREKAGMKPLPEMPATQAGGMTPEMINSMVERLAAKLKDNPNDHAGWARLARAYKVQNRLDEAAQAYEKTGPLLQSDADVMLQYADLLAMRAQGSLQGKAVTLIHAALALQPNHPMGLMLAGQAAFQAGQYAQAIGHWEKALTVLPPDAPDRGAVNQEIAQAKAKLAGK